MRGAAIVALVLVAGGLLAHLMLADPGYVAIRAGRTLFETTLPATWMALPSNRSFSVIVVLPASGWEMMAKVRREAMALPRSDLGGS